MPRGWIRLTEHRKILAEERQLRTGLTTIRENTNNAFNDTLSQLKSKLEIEVAKNANLENELKHVIECNDKYRAENQYQLQDIRRYEGILDTIGMLMTFRNCR